MTAVGNLTAIINAITRAASLTIVAHTVGVRIMGSLTVKKRLRKAKRGQGRHRSSNGNHGHGRKNASPHKME